MGICKLPGENSIVSHVEFYLYLTSSRPQTMRTQTTFKHGFYNQSTTLLRNNLSIVIYFLIVAQETRHYCCALR